MFNREHWVENIVPGSSPSRLCVYSLEGGVWHPDRPKQSGTFSATSQAGWAPSKSRLHGSVPGLVIAQSLVAGNTAILTMLLPDESWLPRDQGKHNWPCR